MGSSTLLIEKTALQRVTGDSSTASATQFVQTINDAYHMVCEAYDWPWLEVRSAVNLVAAYTTGTVTLVDDTTDYVTTTGTWSTGWSPVRLRTAASHDYLLTYNGSNSRWELDRDIVTAEAGVAYTLYKDTYALAARMRSVYLGWETTQDEYPLGLITESEMQVLRSQPFSSSTPPTRISLVEPDSTNLVSQMMVWPIPSAVGTIHYRGYRQVADMSADADIFQFPLQVLPAFRMLARALAFEFRGAMDRARAERQEYEMALARLTQRADNTANAQDSISLSPTHFMRRTGTDGGYYTDDGTSVY